jgi:hypothetical protein
MMMHLKNVVMPAVLTAMVLGGCSSTSEETTETPSIPDWVRKPVVEGGLAASECVNWSGKWSLDKSESVANARAALAKQIGTQVEAMDKTYNRRVKTESGTVTGGTFESGSKQVANEYLQGTRATKVEMVTMPGGKKNLCSMVTLDPETTKKLFEEIVKQSDRDDQLDARDEEALYEEFKAQQFQKELDTETESEG